ncbi:hypothetical protein EDB92DRAFT_1844466 [Lactarius akahatsu]|uniref:Uncharacterized protein n=1 Tax=Lactarius akahatsu TaxID=416441 RepID=A0AAD4LK39_9AGAM|nr:hypothetical protein EDB92DRAFT_1844466 [Lactarius akahatsu]
MSCTLLVPTSRSRHYNVRPGEGGGALVRPHGEEEKRWGWHVGILAQHQVDFVEHESNSLTRLVPDTSCDPTCVPNEPSLVMAKRKEQVHVIQSRYAFENSTEKVARRQNAEGTYRSCCTTTNRTRAPCPPPPRISAPLDQLAAALNQVVRVVHEEYGGRVVGHLERAGVEDTVPSPCHSWQMPVPT